MAEYERTFYFCDPLPQSSWRPSCSSSSASCHSCHSDEGYHSDEKRTFAINYTDQQWSREQKRSSPPEREIPILKSSRTIRISYTPATYTLTLAIILLSIHILITHPPPWTHTFPPVFVFFHLAFHLTHLFAHTFEHLAIERHCVVYGTWLYWTGWLLGIFVFTERLAIDLTHPTTTLFWLLMLERRNSWGLIVWEFVSRLDQNIPPTTHLATKQLKLWQLGSFRLLAFRIWCLLGTGSFWGLLYITLAKRDGFTLVYLLQFSNIFRLLLVSAAGGLMMICFWSFWTFQYRGVLWRRELRKGVVVWYSEGVARAGDVE